MARNGAGRLDGKVAIVTGGCGGIGSHVVRRLAEESAAVTVVDLDESAAVALRDELAGEGLEISVAVGDVSDGSFVEEVVNALPTPAGILVNGAAMRTFSSVLELESGLMERHLLVNTVAPALWTRAVAARLIDAGEGGSIVNLTSIVAHRGFAKNGAYSASKAALLGFSRCAALDLGPHRIRVNCVAPGPTRTPLTAELLADEGTVRALESRIPLGRIGEPEDIAGAVVFLASDESAWVTGTTIGVDGGYTVV
jgi:NAD(P)-dependent dehydrogenase (short-subunit alcohol dehydrogenase family)